MASIRRLRRLLLRSFRSIVGPAQIDFPENGLVLIQGKNLDTGGSSGSGKSNLLAAIAYAFDYAPYSASSLQNWDDETPVEVQVDIGTEAGDAHLVRGKKPSLLVDGTLVKGSVKAVNESLEALMGLHPDLLEALTYRGQGRNSHFLSMKDDAKKDFLASVVPEVAAIEALAVEAEANAKKIAVQLEAARAVHARAEAALVAAEAAVQPLQLQDIAVLISEENSLAAEVEKRKTAAFVSRRHHEHLSAVAQAQIDAARAECAQALAPLKEQLRAISAEVQPAADDAELKKLLGHQAECDKRLKAAREQDASKAADIAALKADAESDLRSAELVLAREASFREKQSRLREELETMADGRCPTCSQQWKNVAREQEIRVLLRDGEKAAFAFDEARATMTRAQKSLNELPVLTPDPTIAKLEAAARTIVSKLANERAKLATAKEAWEGERAKRSGAISQQMLAFKTQCETQEKQIRDEHVDALVSAVDAIKRDDAALAEATRKHKDAQLAKDSAQRANEVASARQDEQRKAVERAEIDADVASIELSGFEQEYAHELDLAHMAGNNGFLGAIFEEILAEIAAETNSILASVPNSAHISLRFLTETTTGAGTQKRVITPRVNVRGHEGPIDTYTSGGQGTVIELAVDLAVIEVVSRRTGVTPGWLVLDEAFNGLGVVEKEMCLEVLSRYAKDRVVLIVDHDNQFKEMFAKTITLEFSDGITTVKEAA